MGALPDSETPRASKPLAALGVLVYRTSAVLPYALHSGAAAVKSMKDLLSKTSPAADRSVPRVHLPRLVGERPFQTPQGRRVKLRAVVVSNSGGNPSLRVPGVALGWFRLRQDQHTAGGSQADGGAQSGDSASNDQEIRVVGRQRE